MWGQRIDFKRFLGDSLTPWGIPFSALGVTFSLSGALEAEILCFLGQPGSRSDFGTKCSRISGCLGWLKQWFGVRGVVKITLSPKLEFLRFGASFGGHFGSKNDTKVEMWLTLGLQCGKVGLTAGWLAGRWLAGWPWGPQDLRGYGQEVVTGSSPGVW